jgi:acetyltransferase EpsM
MYLYGASGHCKVIIDIINESKECSIDGIVDDSPNWLPF